MTKKKQIHIFVTDTEDLAIREKAKTAHMPLKEYMLSAALQHEIVIIDGLEDVIRLQKEISHRLSQLITSINTAKWNPTDLQELLVSYHEVSSVLSGILKRKRWS